MSSLWIVVDMMPHKRQGISGITERLLVC